MLNAQKLTLDDCYAKARSNFPLVKQLDLLEKSKSYTLSNIARGWIPKISINARATYQTAVTQIPFDENTQIPITIDLPIIGSITQNVNVGFDIPKISKDQYRATIELVQPIFDGGYSMYQKNVAKAEIEVEQQSIEEALYQLNNKINDIYFGILLIDGYIEQTNIFLNEVQRNKDNLHSLINNGLANELDRKNLQIEVLNAEQKMLELKNNRQNLVSVLAAMLGENLSEDVQLEIPDLQENTIKITENNRPELKKYSAQEQYLDAMRKMLNVPVLPQIGLFIQAGYGRPGLDMLNNNFAPFAIGGIQLQWDISGFYTRNNDLKRLNIQREKIVLQKETFLYTSNLETIQQNSEIKKLQNLLEKDKEIVALRAEIRMATEKKMQSGLVSMSDYLKELNMEQIANQSLINHKLQMLLEIAKLKVVK
jgi:outer membrane protein TolC